MTTALIVILFVLAVAGLSWWRVVGKRRVERKLKYNSEKRQEKIEEGDRAWREKQEQKEREKSRR